MIRPRDQHVLPAGDLVDHDETRRCWCTPRLEAECPERCGDGCWRCEDGWIATDADDPGGVVVVHNAADGRP